MTFDVFGTPALPNHMATAILVGPGGCWLWQRSTDRDGYAWTSYKDKTYQAHRFIYTWLKGAIPPGLVLDHLCRVRHCVNPNHMEPVTNAENLRRGDTPAGWKVCRRCGDEFGWIGKAKPQRRCLRCMHAYEVSRGKRRPE